MVLIITIIVILVSFLPSIIILSGAYILDFIDILKDKDENNKYSLKEINREIVKSYGRYNFFVSEAKILIFPLINYISLIFIIQIYIFKFLDYIFIESNISNIFKFIWNLIKTIFKIVFLPITKLYNFVEIKINKILEIKFI